MPGTQVMDDFMVGTDESIKESHCIYDYHFLDGTVIRCTEMYPSGTTPYIVVDSEVAEVYREAITRYSILKVIS